MMTEDQMAMKLAEKLKYWQENLKDFFIEFLNEQYIWDGMEQMFEAIPRAIKEHKPLIISSGHALSKDYTFSGVMLWFCYCYQPSKVIFTAPTDRQVTGIMWAELKRKWRNKIFPTPGRLLSCNLDIKPEHFILGFTTKETGGMVGKFQGFHARNVMVLVSEAQAVSDTIFDEIDGILTSQNSLLVMIGNPLRTTGRFAKAIKDKKNNIVIELSCLDSPNYIARKEIIPGLCSYQWVEDKRQRWGEQDPRWISKVLGKLPSVSINTVFSDELVDMMVDRIIRDAQEKRAIGCDVARFGDDDTVIYGNEGGKIIKEKLSSHQRLPATASDCLIMAREIQASIIVVDGDGLGQGVVDDLWQMRGDIDVVEVHGNAKSEDEQYQNQRAEMWFYAKEQAENGRVSIPNDRLLIDELKEVQYFINSKGKIQLEAKEDLKERLGRSPDRADAWVLSVWGLKQARRNVRLPNFRNMYAGGRGGW